MKYLGIHYIFYWQLWKLYIVFYMKNKSAQGFALERWKLLTETVGTYVPGVNFPKHTTVSIRELQEYVAQFVTRIPKSKTWLIGFEGLPAVGKSSKVTKIEDASRKALWFSEPQELVTYNNPEGKVIEVGGYVCKKANAVIVTIHADHFFRAIGQDRRDKMVKNKKDCKKLWWDPRKAIKFIHHLAEGKDTDVKIYTSTPEEKAQKMALGSIKIKVPNQPHSTKVVIAEWVNVGEWVNVIRKKTSIQTLTVLYNTSFEDSMIRALRRDKKSKWSSFQKTLEDRLPEYYNILELYMQPSLENKDTILLDKKREVPPFTALEKEEIIQALHLAYQKHSIDPEYSLEHQKFMGIYYRSLLERFMEMEVFTQNEIELWDMKKNLKKEKKKYKNRKKIKAEGNQSWGQSSKKDIANTIKAMKKIMRDIKSRIEAEKKSKT